LSTIFHFVTLLQSIKGFSLYGRLEVTELKYLPVQRLFSLTSNPGPHCENKEHLLNTTITLFKERKNTSLFSPELIYN